MDITTIRNKVEGKSGRDYWKSLDELADSKDFHNYLESEFPREASFFEQAIDRRNFLKLMAASLVMVGVTSCGRSPLEEIIPYTKQPEDLIPGKPLYFATAVLLNGLAQSVLVESHMGRPTKIEGNPEHPESKGKADIFAQANILELYDPERSHSVMHDGAPNDWDSFVKALDRVLTGQKAKAGAGLRILTGTVTSPTLAAQIKQLLGDFPKAIWHSFEPLNRDEARKGLRLAFGEPVDAHYRLEKANVILSLDADFFSPGPGQLTYIRDFSNRRRVRFNQKSKMNRLYSIESTPGLVGSMADHRISLRSREIKNAAILLAKELGIQTGSTPKGLDHKVEKWIQALAKDLLKNRSNSAILVGDEQPAEVHTLAVLMNQKLTNIGTTVIYAKTADHHPTGHTQSIQKLSTDMGDGKVEALLVVGANPVYDAPCDLDFAEKLKNVPFRVHMGLYEDETAHVSNWHLPQVHSLESWSDAKSFGGTTSIIQPLIRPLYNGISPHVLFGAAAGNPERSAHDIVKDYWKETRGIGFETFWQQTIHDGFIPRSQHKPIVIPVLKTMRIQPSVMSSDIEINFRKDPTLWDGRYANNGWLQELPKPLTKMTWDNAAFLSPKLAERLKLQSGDVVRLGYKGRELEAPVWIQPGVPDYSVTVHLGYGRKRAGQVGNQHGFNAYSLRTSKGLWSDTGLEIRKTGKKYKFAMTQDHHSMENRHLVRSGTIKEFEHHPRFVHEEGHEPLPNETLYGHDRQYTSYAWGMSVDLNTCVGCNACVTACQSENNIPIVGKEEVARGREMHWIRVDRYYKGDIDDPETVHQPVMCQHCENAPCEPVCPVEATLHGPEGLNQMIYNRCVGTRYCSNNCPYKVRRFNFFQYADKKTESWKLMQNPDVTVRSRGVMEKCTYCVQRINVARIESEKENRKIRDGEIVTACQSACPAGAIVFGDKNNTQSKVADEKREPHSYGILAELNTRPRTTYMAKIKNPNPALETTEKHDS